ncbi:MAG: mobile mystery protein B, partial [Proteobacteria bacterium]|nr:mobile mystery protein B [Pseudomonadota bacterium]
MSGLFDEPDDATPLTPEERDGLLQSWITYRAELNLAEQRNIEAGATSAYRWRGDVLTDDFLRRLHARLFGEVWAWAGDYRLTERNIGIDPARIPGEVRMVMEDARYWIDNATWPLDEAAVRLHHRLVAIHPFPNGNGRTTRLMADLLAVRLGREPFSWGRASLTEIGDTRQRYIAALRTADNHDIGPLLHF